MEKTKVERIDSIIKAALLEFTEKGFENTSMNLIAERANLSKGGLYHHFKSKDDLLFAVNNQIMRPLVQLMREAESMESPLNGLNLFIKGYIVFWYFHKKELEITLTAISKLLKAETKKDYLEYINNMKHFLEYLLIKGIEKGEIKNINAGITASIIFTNLEGNIIRIAADKGVEIEEIIDEIKKIIIEPLIFKLSWL